MTAPKPRLSPLPFIAFALILCVTFAMQQVFIKQEENLIQAMANEEARLFSQSIEDQFNSAIIAIQRQAERWEARKGTPINEWRQDAKHYIEDFSALRTLEWVDNSYHVRWVEPMQGNEDVVGLNIIFDDERRAALEGAAKKDRITLTKPLDLVQGYRAVIAYVPIYYDKEFQGFIVGLMDLGMFFEDHVRTVSQESLEISILDNDRVVFTNHSETVSLQNEFSATSRISLFDRHWNITINPTQQFIDMHTSRIPELAAILGSIIALFASISIYYAIKLKYKNKALSDVTNDLKIANEELEEFAYRTSHDLRSPLISSITVINMAKEALTEDNKQEVEECLDHAKDSLSTLEQLVQDILALTQTKNQEEDEQDVEVSALIDDALSKFSHMDGFDRLTITKHISYDAPITVKKSRVTLIVENLISNAIKYQDSGEAEPYLKISTDKEKDSFIFKVEDNGVGIPKEHQDQLFQMFKRFHNQSYGSGLGLYMMKKSATVMGADLVFEEANKGTIFKLIIPMK